MIIPEEIWIDMRYHKNVQILANCLALSVLGQLVKIASHLSISVLMNDLGILS